jgi:hypothetical protein
MGQESEFEQVTTIKELDSTFNVMEVMNMPWGESKDAAIISKKNLHLIKRNMDQGPLNIELNYSDTEVSGQMNMSGNLHPVKIKTTGPCLAEGPGAFFVLATLPLADQYTAQIRNIDLHGTAEKFYTVEVVGTETVLNKSCYKLKMVAANGDPGEVFVWISKGPNPKPLKYEMTLPEFNGGSMKGELKP